MLISLKVKVSSHFSPWVCHAQFASVTCASHLFGRGRQQRETNEVISDPPSPLREPGIMKFKHRRISVVIMLLLICMSFLLTSAGSEQSVRELDDSD